MDAPSQRRCTHTHHPIPSHTRFFPCCPITDRPTHPPTHPSVSSSHFHPPFFADEYTALEPHISKRTCEIHHDKHHAKYVAVTNEMIKGTELENASLEEIIKASNGRWMASNGRWIVGGDGLCCGL